MGRPAKTDEARKLAVPVETQVELVVAWQRRERSRRQAETDLEGLKAAVAAALGEDGISVRDVAAVLGLPSSTVQELVRPHRQNRRAA